MDETDPPFNRRSRKIFLLAFAQEEGSAYFQDCESKNVYFLTPPYVDEPILAPFGLAEVSWSVWLDQDFSITDREFSSLHELIGFLEDELILARVRRQLIDASDEPVITLNEEEILTYLQRCRERIFIRHRRRQTKPF